MRSAWYVGPRPPPAPPPAPPSVRSAGPPTAPAAPLSRQRSQISSLTVCNIANETNFSFNDYLTVKQLFKQIEMEVHWFHYSIFTEETSHQVSTGSQPVSLDTNAM